jgi:hypothetical protein
MEGATCARLAGGLQGIEVAWNQVEITSHMTEADKDRMFAGEEGGIGWPVARAAACRGQRGVSCQQVRLQATCQARAASATRSLPSPCRRDPGAQAADSQEHHHLPRLVSRPAGGVPAQRARCPLHLSSAAAWPGSLNLFSHPPPAAPRRACRWFNDAKQTLNFITELFTSGTLRQCVPRLGQPAAPSATPAPACTAGCPPACSPPPGTWLQRVCTQQHRARASL